MYLLHIGKWLPWKLDMGNIILNCRLHVGNIKYIDEVKTLGVVEKVLISAKTPATHNVPTLTEKSSH